MTFHPTHPKGHWSSRYSFHCDNNNEKAPGDSNNNLEHGDDNDLECFDDNGEDGAKLCKVVNWILEQWKDFVLIE